MKQLYFLFCMVFTGLIHGQIINFPDANFKAKLLEPGVAFIYMGGFNYQIDVNGNGEIEVSEAQLVWALNVSNSNISDLTGISYFIGLKSLNCSNNLLTNLTISSPIALNTIIASYNALTSADLNFQLNGTGDIKLDNNNLISFAVPPGYHDEVDLSHNQLTDLILDNTHMDYFNASYNNLSSLQVNGVTGAYFWAQLQHNQFTSLDLSHFTSFDIDSSILMVQGNDDLESIAFGSSQPMKIYYSAANSTSFDLGNYSLLPDCYGVHPAVYITSSPNLDHVVFKNGFNHHDITCNEGNIFQISGMDVTISNCPNLSYLCVDDGEIDFFQTRVTQLGLQSQVTVGSNCTSSVLDLETVAYREQFTIYPIPAKNVLEIHSNDNLEISNIEIYNQLGQIVQKAIGNQQNIDVSQLARGSYYLKIKTKNGTSTKQFLKD
jgi:hypothetical protein